MAEPIFYVTSNKYKRVEAQALIERCRFADNHLINEVFNFEFISLSIPERLETDIVLMVQHEVLSAYEQARVPCIVEHAGLIFEGLTDYPGGLTKPMWDTLGPEGFIAETQAANRMAIARSVVAYCDGMKTRCFVGETVGTIATKPRGQRKFYWDTVFVPKDEKHNPSSNTHAEIADDPKRGVEYKVVHLSQSAKALLQFLEYRREEGPSKLFV